MTIPKLSAPLTKAIRTSEGILVWGVNIAVGVASAIPAAHLTVKEAAIIATINTGAHTAQRGLLKAIALGKGAGIDPIPFTPPAAVATVVGDVAAVAPTIVDQVSQDLGKTPSVDQVEQQIVTDAQVLEQGPPEPTPVQA